VIKQSPELSFQMIFAAAVKIRHGGSKESIEAVRRQRSNGIPDRLTQSADVLNYISGVRM